MGVIQIWNPKKNLDELIGVSIDLVRKSKSAATMKNYLRCYDILDLTKKINEPWNKPGKMIADMAAFVDLEVTTRQILFDKDPSTNDVLWWSQSVKKLIEIWKHGVENEMLIHHASYDASSLTLMK